MPSHLADKDTFTPEHDALGTHDPLGFEGYAPEHERAREESRTDESLVYGAAQIGGTDVEMAAFNFSFFGGSMGEVAGERLARAMERAVERNVTFVLRTETGGARMQEGMRSLIQMPKVVAARIEMGNAGIPFIAVLGHPTTGGVLASIAGLADVTVAEAGATIGFAGPRVAKAFTGEELPEGSHTATFAYANGMVDELLSAGDAPSYVSHVLKVLAPDQPEAVEEPRGPGDPEEIEAWPLVEKVRSGAHPKASSLGRSMAETMVELRGDRTGSDDPAILTAFARVAGRRVLVIAHDRDHSPRPEGYRKARRCLEIAGRLRLPVVTLIDMRGADPSSSSEAGGIAWEIAALFERMLRMPVPVYAVVTGEGGSGGALAFAVADRLAAFEVSYFSVIGPEGAAQILWRDVNRAPEAAEKLRLTPSELLSMGVIDEVLQGVASPDVIRRWLATNLDAVVPEDLARARRRRWRTR